MTKIKHVEIKETLKAILIETLNLNIEPEELDGNESLYFGLGLDSLSVITFIVAIEKKFNVMIEDEDINFDNLENINLI